MFKILTQRLFVATILGNVMEHYDKVLFGLIAPFIAPLFFPNQDPIVALILIYLPMGIIARPLGAIYWGYIGDRYGRKRALYYSILGMSLTLLLTGLLPTYQKVGLLSPCLMHFYRGLICFFAAGEGPGASLLLIENSQEQNKDLMSSYYEMSSMLGVLIASTLITWLSFQGKVLETWRLLFIVSGIIGFIGFWVRRDAFEGIEFKTEKISINPLPLLKEYAPAFFAIVCVTGFSYGNYRILTQLMSSHLPLVTSLTHTEMMGTQSVLILYDFFLLFPFGLLSKKIGKEKLILCALICAALGVFPLFKLLDKPTLTNVLILRMTLVTWGVALAAPFNYWASHLVPKEVRYRVLSLARSIGAQAIGGTAISLSLFIYKMTGTLKAPAFVIFIISFLAIFSLLLLSVFEKRKQKLKKNFSKNKRLHNFVIKNPNERYS